MIITFVKIRSHWGYRIGGWSFIGEYQIDGGNFIGEYQIAEWNIIEEYHIDGGYIN